MKSLLVRQIWIAYCLLQLPFAILAASGPMAVISPKQLGVRWPGLVAGCLEKGASVKIVSAKLSTAHEVWVRMLTTSYTMHVQLVVRSCYLEGFETAYVSMDAEGWSKMPQDQVVTGISNETWSKMDQFMRTHQIAASKTTTKGRWEDGKFAFASHSCEIQLPIKDSDKLLELLKIYFEALPDEGILHIWQH
jgi:hypothetical protein